MGSSSPLPWLFAQSPAQSWSPRAPAPSKGSWVLVRPLDLGRAATIPTAASNVAKRQSNRAWQSGKMTDREGHHRTHKEGSAAGCQLHAASPACRCSPQQSSTLPPAHYSYTLSLLHLALWLCLCCWAPISPFGGLDVWCLYSFYKGGTQAHTSSLAFEASCLC